MKKFIIFAISFMFFYTLLFFSSELLSGIFLTSKYVPDMSEAWGSSTVLPQKIEMFSNSSLFSISLLIALLSASVAYLTAQKYSQHSQN